MIRSYDTGAVVLLPEKIERLATTGQLGPMLVAPHHRQAQWLVVFDPINNINNAQIYVDGWQELRPNSGSYLCMPVGLRVEPLIPPIRVFPGMWGMLNEQVMGNPLESCTPVNWVVHSQPWRRMENNMDPDLGASLMNSAVEYISWEQDDAQFRKDTRLAQNLHLLSPTDLVDVMGYPLIR